MHRDSAFRNDNVISWIFYHTFQLSVARQRPVSCFIVTSLQVLYDAVNIIFILGTDSVEFLSKFVVFVLQILFCCRHSGITCWNDIRLKAIQTNHSFFFNWLFIMFVSCYYLANAIEMNNTHYSSMPSYAFIRILSLTFLKTYVRVIWDWIGKRRSKWKRTKKHMIV